jgi:hypothetical protein
MGQTYTFYVAVSVHKHIVAYFKMPCNIFLERPRKLKRNLKSRESVTIPSHVHVCMYVLCMYVCIVTCTGGTRDDNNSSRSDDWIYWHFGYNLS